MTCKHCTYTSAHVEMPACTHVQNATNFCISRECTKCCLRLTCDLPALVHEGKDSLYSCKRKEGETLEKKISSKRLMTRNPSSFGFRMQEVAWSKTGAGRQPFPFFLFLTGAWILLGVGRAPGRSSDICKIRKNALVGCMKAYSFSMSMVSIASQ